MHINDNIKKARDLRGLSQQQIAVKLDEKRSTYAEWEKETVPRADIFFKICDVLDVNPADLIEENWIPDEKTSGIPERKSKIKQKKVSLETIAADLQHILTHQVLSRAEIRSFGEYQVLKDAQGDREKKEEIMEQINKILALNIKAVAREDIRSGENN